MEESYPRDPHDRTPRCGLGPRWSRDGPHRRDHLLLLGDGRSVRPTDSFVTSGSGVFRAGPVRRTVGVRVPSATHVGAVAVSKDVQWTQGPWTGAVSSSGTRSCWGRRAGGVHERSRNVGTTTLHDSVAHDPDDGPAHRRGDAAPLTGHRRPRRPGPLRCLKPAPYRVLTWHFRSAGVGVIPPSSKSRSESASPRGQRTNRQRSPPAFSPRASLSPRPTRVAQPDRTGKAVDLMDAVTEETEDESLCLDERALGANP